MAEFEENGSGSICSLKQSITGSPFCFLVGLSGETEKGNERMITIKRVSLDIPRGRRILAVSDIHGHVHFLKKVLEKAGFCEDDELIIDGDIIEKGPYSLETLRYVMELDKKPNVHVISGNVDSWQLELIGSREPERTRALAEFIRTAKKRWGGSLFLDFCEEWGSGIRRRKRRQPLPGKR